MSSRNIIIVLIALAGVTLGCVYAPAAAWSKTTTRSSVAPSTWNPIVVNDVLYTVLQGSSVTAHAVATGVVQWTTSIPDVAGGCALDGTNLVCGGHSAVHKLDATTGSYLGNLALGTSDGEAATKGVPVVSAGIAYVGTTGGSAIAITVATMTALWSVTLGSGIPEGVSGPATLWNGNVVFGTYSGNIFVRSIVDGSAVAMYSTTGAPAVPAYIVGGTVFGITGGMPILNGVLFYCTAQSAGNHIALDLTTGTQLWRATPHPLNPAQVTPVVYGGVLYSVSQGGRLSALNVATGSVLWSVSHSSPQVTSTGLLAIDAVGIAHVPSNNGVLMGVSTVSHSIVYTFSSSVRTVTATAAVTAESRVYIVGDSTAAINLGCNTPAPTALPTSVPTLQPPKPTCPAGTHDDLGNCVTCPFGAVSDAGALECTMCQQGQEANAAQTQCQDCGLGTFSPGPGGACGPCPPGYIADVVGAATCSPCAPGTEASADASQCLDCSPGMFNSDSASTCTACPPGSVSPSSRAEQCSTCPTGTEASADATVCNSCPIGSFNSVEGGVCATCDDGYVTTSEGQDTCRQCIAGQEASGDHTTCLFCNPGTFNAVDGGTCTPCDPGLYTADTGSQSCQQCPAAMTPSADQTSCVSITCPAFQFVHPSVWTAAALQESDYPPLVLADASRVITVHRDRSIFARDIDTGNELWSRNINAVGGASVDAITGSVVVGTKDGLLVLDPSGAGAVMLLPDGAGIPCSRGAPLLVQYGSVRYAYVGTTRGFVVAFNLNAGTVAWTKRYGLRHAITSSMSVWGSSVIACTYSGRVYVLDGVTGDFVAMYQDPTVPRYIVNGPVFGIQSGGLVVDNTLYFSLSTARNNFVALDLSSMTQRWAITLSEGSFGFTLPAVYDGKILTTTSNGGFFVVSTNGDILGQYNSGRSMKTTGPVAVLYGVALLQSNYGHLDAVDIATGVRRGSWYNYRLGTFASTPAVSGHRFFQAGGMRDAAGNTNCLP